MGRWMDALKNNPLRYIAGNDNPAPEPAHQDPHQADKQPPPANAVWVRCANCQHFQPDTIGDGTGIGNCLTGHKPRGGNEPPLYPRARRYCASFKQR
jgi:hypothetical protein